MSNEKISSLELISALSEQTGITKKNATAFMRQFAETVEAALLHDGIVKIKGFGTFKIVWNESRSSVNVQTGARYEIAGHNKISFIPDDEMRDIVNHPYAHLEPVDLDGNSIKKPEEKPEEDPHMKRFSEQANEIVNMIAEMQAFRPKTKLSATPNDTKKETAEAPATSIEPENEPKKVEEPAKIVKEEPIVNPTTETFPLPVLTEVKEISTETPVQESIIEAAKSTVEQRKSTEIAQPIISETPAQQEKTTDLNAKNALEEDLIHRMNEQSETRSHKWLYITLIGIILLGGIGVAAYHWYPAVFHWLTTEKTTGQAPAPAIQPAVQAPVTVPQDSATTEQNTTPAEQPKKPSDDVFSTLRVYTDFITTETAVQGISLTQLALQYYGHKLFWVYIYEANKNVIRDPGILPPGTKIKIPNLDPRLIDINDGRCLRQASALQTKYITKH